jgi:DNA-binding NarL/FixJ family response regulator
MNLTLILEAASVSGLVAVACFTAVFFAARKKFRAERSQHESALQEQNQRFESLQKQFETCDKRLAEAEQRSSAAVEASYPASIHLNRRGQVVQMHRRGENPRTIASALGISQGEVKLMIKLHELNGTAAVQKN